MERRAADHARPHDPAVQREGLRQRGQPAHGPSSGTVAVVIDEHAPALLIAQTLKHVWQICVHRKLAQVLAHDAGAPELCASTGPVKRQLAKDEAE
eukprot:scaffold18939_cov69-Phaeocystis_antarctica.AAC.4